MKDLGLAMSAAQQKGVPVPLGQLATTMYEALGKNPDVRVLLLHCEEADRR